jgi:hypothetical protein
MTIAPKDTTEFVFISPTGRILGETSRENLPLMAPRMPPSARLFERTTTFKEIVNDQSQKEEARSQTNMEVLRPRFSAARLER